jgi:hypothetical protein
LQLLYLTYGYILHDDCTLLHVRGLSQVAAPLFTWLCHALQANSVAIQAAGCQLRDVLAVQVMQLCQCLDSLSSQLRAKDNVDKLKAKQQLRGRQRQARLMAGSNA